MPDSRKTTGTEEETVVDFATFLAAVRPKTAHELGEAVQHVTSKVRDTGKKGSITLTLTIEPLNGETDVLAVNDEIRVKAPEHSRKGSLAYPDAHNNLSRTDPSAMPLFDESFRTAEPFNPATGEFKEPPTA
jgi:hypothetical protein